MFYFLTASCLLSKTDDLAIFQRILKQSFLTAVFPRFCSDLDFVYSSETATGKKETYVIDCGKTHIFDMERDR